MSLSKGRVQRSAFGVPRSSITGYRLPVTDYRLPVTDYRLPITDYRLPITDYRLPINDYRLLITDYKFNHNNMLPFSNIPQWLDLLIAFLIGTGFGFALEQAGFSSSRKLAGMFYGYDTTV